MYSLFRAVGVFFVVVSVYLLFVNFLVSPSPYLSLPIQFKEGTFGDSFGSLNALFSGLAFAGVILTLLLQRKDLAGQRRDIEDARKQALHSKIESQFYTMLTLQQNALNSFDVKRKGEVLYSGRDCFKAWYRLMEQEYRKIAPDKHSRLDDAYEVMWLKYQGDLSLYYRSLYSVFRYISESGHPDSARFGSVVRSFLSDFELVVLYYNCLSEKGRKFKKYISEFKVFDNLDIDMLIDVGELVEFDVESFGDNEAALYLQAILK